MSPRRKKKKQKTSNTKWIVAAIVGLAVFWMLNNNGGGGNNNGGGGGQADIDIDSGGDTGPAPDNGGVSKLEGAIVYVHDRDPMPADEQRIIVDTRKFCEANDDLQYRSIDQRDPSDAVQKILQRANESGQDPPFAMHKRPDGSLKFVPMDGTFDSIKKSLVK